MRSHIEQIPIPTANEKEQEHILTIVEKILTASDTNMIQNWYERLDRMVAQLYGLTMEEYNIIKASTEGENLFLYSPEKHSS